MSDKHKLFGGSFISEWRKFLDLKAQKQVLPKTERAIRDLITEIAALQAQLASQKEENEKLRNGLTDVRARTQQILHHHTMPRQKRHGSTSGICQDMLSRIKIALEKPPLPDK